jgi:predicted O-methyltransferase YrrM
MLDDPKLEALLEALHARSEAQVTPTRAYFSERFHKGEYIDLGVGEDRKFMADKLVALEADKAEFCYALCRALGARRVVEAGTSFGISTLYLAAAVRDNLRAVGGRGVVIGTEYEPAKAKEARANFTRAGLSEFIELREGDMRETLRDLDGPIDFALIDIWIPMARPALERIAPHLSEGAVVICDNTRDHREAYADYFAYLSDPANRFRTMTLPFNGGLEMSVREAPSP